MPWPYMPITLVQRTPEESKKAFFEFTDYHRTTTTIHHTALQSAFSHLPITLVRSRPAVATREQPGSIITWEEKHHVRKETKKTIMWMIGLDKNNFPQCVILSNVVVHLDLPATLALQEVRRQGLLDCLGQLCARIHFCGKGIKICILNNTWAPDLCGCSQCQGRRRGWWS